MKITKVIAARLEGVKRMEMCPSLLNLYVNRYSFSLLLNDIFAGIKIFLLLFPIAFSLAFFCGASPVQGIISCAIAAAVAAVFGGSKYQITSIALPICVITFEIISKYQYKGLLVTAVFVSALLILFGLLRISEVLKHISYAFVSALSIYVVLAIITNQAQYILGINTIQSSQGLLENFDLLKGNLENMTSSGIMTCLGFMLPLVVLKMFFRGFSPFFLYIALGTIVAYIGELGYLPGFIEIKTIGKELVAGQAIDNITTISKSMPSQTVLGNALNYAFVIALVIASQACFCTNVSSSITGDRRLQTNMELISSGISNFASVACGGLFVSPDINFSLKNIQFKSKTIISMIVFAALCYGFISFSNEIMRYMPVYCISSILIVYAMFEFFNRQLSQYLNFKSNDCYIFIATLFIALYFGFISAVIVGFTMSSVFFSKRMIRIKDASVHTTKNHDTGAIEFMTNKNGFSKSQNIPEYILDKIEVIQVSNILFLNIAKVVEEALTARGKFPSVIIIYFKNVPFLDGEAISSLKNLVKNAKKKDAIVMVSGTNGMLLDILQQKAESEKSNDVFGYIIPNFEEAIRQTVKRLENH